MRLFARIFVFASSLFIILYGILPGFFKVEGDFIAFYVAGRNILHGTDPVLFYRFPDFQQLVDTSGLSTRIFSVASSTPASFLIDTILAVAPAGFSKFILTAINIAAFVLLVHVSAKLANSSIRTAYVVFLSSSFALATNFSSGEPFIIVSLFFALAFLAFSISAERASGTILGVIFPFEVFAIAPALLFLLAKRWKVFIYFLLMSLILLSIAYLLVGESTIVYYLQRVFPFYFNARVLNPFSISYQTAWSFLRTIFLLDPALNPHPLFASARGYMFSISMFKALVLVPSAYFFYRGIEKKNAREALVAGTFPVLFLSPTAASYQLVLMAPAIICLGQTALEEQKTATARLFIVLYVLACLPIHSFLSNSLNIQTPFILFERFFLLVSIYAAYLIFQMRHLPKHLLAVRMSITTAIIAAVTITLYAGTSDMTSTVPAVPVLSGDQLRSVAFSPAVFGNKLEYVGLDSTSQNYVIKSGSDPNFLDPPENCYRVSIDEKGENSGIETTDENRIVVSFRTEYGTRFFAGTNCSVSRDGDLGSFITGGKLFIVDLRERQIPVVDSMNILPFKITQETFNVEKKFAGSSTKEIVLLIDSLNGANSIATYNPATRNLQTHRTVLHASAISADGEEFYATSEDGDSTSIWSQRGDDQPIKLFSVHGNIMDINVADHTLYFSSDFERGLSFPTIYRWTFKNHE
ncbi:MAG TPA: glycosyltransferase 87 family protein [Candidatus Acidoferrales bacterium]|nr:glycosyltransferase 87 family protein [Candidatus Acidoferrales bacterium]